LNFAGTVSLADVLAILFLGTFAVGTKQMSLHVRRSRCRFFAADRYRSATQRQ
jgi:hypothetical protein